MNTKLLQKVKAHILEEPKRFFMSDVYLTGEAGEKFPSDNGTKQPFPKCGTAACIAGWACLLSGETGEDVRMGRAEDLLGITSGEGDRLFLDGFWPLEYRQQYADAKTPDKRAEIAAARIDHFIETKGRE